MALAIEEASSDLDMETLPRTASLPAIDNIAHAERVENNVIALIP